FPHHENERAQSEACTGQKFVNYWMHNNMIEFAGAKMSKSLGNVRTARSFMDAHSPELLKYLILSVHYRSICDFSESQLQNITRSLARIYSALAQAEKSLAVDSASGPSSRFDEWSSFLKEQDQKISQALDDDFNTPEALGSVFEVVRRFNSEMSSKSKSKALAEDFRNWVLGWGRLFSLFQTPARDFLRKLDDQLLKNRDLNRDVIQAKVDSRWQARLAKDWKRSDALRDELRAIGIELQDSSTGTEWEVAK
ncbi:MAG: DALR domain-containing protein, partial [Bdellovibrio sp.]